MKVLTCATVESIQLDPDEGGATRMRGGVPAVSNHPNSSPFVLGVLTLIAWIRSRCQQDTLEAASWEQP